MGTFHTKPLQKTRKETGTLPANHAKKEKIFLLNLAFLSRV